MACRVLYVFAHDSQYGNAPSSLLFNKVNIDKKIENAPRAFTDYEVMIDEEMPEGVE